jgi:hypothetical protein
MERISRRRWARADLVLVATASEFEDPPTAGGVPLHGACLAGPFATSTRACRRGAAGSGQPQPRQFPGSGRDPPTGPGRPRRPPGTRAGGHRSPNRARRAAGSGERRGGRVRSARRSPAPHGRARRARRSRDDDARAAARRSGRRPAQRRSHRPTDPGPPSAGARGSAPTRIGDSRPDQGRGPPRYCITTTKARTRRSGRCREHDAHPREPYSTSSRAGTCTGSPPRARHGTGGAPAAVRFLGRTWWFSRYARRVRLLYGSSSRL